MRSSVPSADSTMMGTSLHCRIRRHTSMPSMSGRPEVEDDDVGGTDGRLGDALFAGGGHEHVVPERAEPDAQDAQQGLVVVDGEDAWPLSARPRGPVRARAG